MVILDFKTRRYDDLRTRFSGKLARTVENLREGARSMERDPGSAGRSRAAAVSAAGPARSRAGLPCLAEGPLARRVPGGGAHRDIPPPGGAASVNVGGC